MRTLMIGGRLMRRGLGWEMVVADDLGILTQLGTRADAWRTGQNYIETKGLSRLRVALGLPWSPDWRERVLQLTQPSVVTVPCPECGNEIGVDGDHAAGCHINTLQRWMSRACSECGAAIGEPCSDNCGMPLALDGKPREIVAGAQYRFQPTPEELREWAMDDDADLTLREEGLRSPSFLDDVRCAEINGVQRPIPDEGLE